MKSKQLTEEFFASNKVGDLLVLFKEGCGRIVSGAGWIKEISVKDRIATLKLSPMMSLDKGVVKKEDDLLLAVALDNASCWNGWHEHQISWGKNTISIYDKHWLIHDGNGSLESLAVYLKELRRAITIVKNCSYDYTLRISRSLPLAKLMAAQ